MYLHRCMMLPRVIFCAAVILATLAVVLMTLLSPVGHGRQSKSNGTSNPWLDLSLYIQQPHIPTPDAQQVIQSDGGGAFIFRRTLTEGPEKTSRAVGKAQGFIIPVEHFSHSAFNIIYLTFDSRDYSGSLSVHADRFAHKEREELNVVGGTGSFAFARGIAVFALTDRQTYHVKLQLRFPNHSQTIPG